MSFNFSELRDLLLAINQTDISEVNLSTDDFKLIVRRGAGEGTTTAPQIVQAVPVVPSLVGSAIATTPSLAVDPRLLEVKSPIVGTFYRAPGPEEASFVEVGDRIRVGQALCIIEAMKVMNEIESELSGEIVEILLENGQPVEYDQVLMRVRSS